MPEVTTRTFVCCDGKFQTSDADELFDHARRVHGTKIRGVEGKREAKLFLDGPNWWSQTHHWTFALIDFDECITGEHSAKRKETSHSYQKGGE